MHPIARKNLFAHTLLAGVVVLLGLSIPRTGLADSPLTSIDFSIDYADHDVVVRAAEVGYDDQVAEALSSRDVPHDVRAAIVNAMGWTLGGQDHAQKYLLYIAASRDKHPRDITLNELTAEEAFSLGYMLAMDDYLDLGPLSNVEGPLAGASPTDILSAARNKAPGSFTIALIAGLVESQAAMSTDWCQVFRRTHDVIESFDGERDLRDEAVERVEEYINLYADECSNPRPVQGP